MRGVVVLPFLLVLMVLSACTSSAERVEPLEVINALSDGIQLDVSRDPAFEAADVSVLSGGDYNFGYFNIHVFKDGVDSQDYEIGEPPRGGTGPRRNELGRMGGVRDDPRPGEGGYRFVKSYGNVVLSTFVDAKEGTWPASTARRVRADRLGTKRALAASRRDGLAEWRGDLLNEHEWREREGIGYRRARRASRKFRAGNAVDRYKVAAANAENLRTAPRLPDPLRARGCSNFSSPASA